MTADLPNLDYCVVSALNLIAKEQDVLRRIKKPKFKRPLIVGSGNAAVTGRIIFADSDAVFANESNYREKLSHIDGAVLMSASGSKHAGEIAQELKRKRIKTVLWTNNPEPPAMTEAGMNKDQIVLFPSFPEPYTYNTSTYGSMIFWKTGEDAEWIKEFLCSYQFQNCIPSNIGKYSGYYLMLESRFDSTRELFTTKFVELFGRSVAKDVYTDEQSKHATTVVPSDELFIEFGETNLHLGDERIVIPLPSGAKEGAMMMVAYYVIGKIQAAKDPVFKNNIERYCREASKTFGKTIETIVDYRYDFHKHK